MKLIPPNLDKKRNEIEKELEFQRQRFIQATEQTTAKIQKDFALINLVRAYPIQTAILMAIGGFFAVQLFHEKKQTRYPV